jgi:dihydrofolate reductase
MRRLIMWNLVTLDGFFEGPARWDVDFHESVWGAELEQLSLEQLRAADTLLFGRVTYEGMAAYWPTAQGEVADLMNEISKVVFSATLEKAAWRHTRLVRRSAPDEIALLKRQPGRDMLIFGSAELSAALWPRRLIDEYRLCLAPLVLGAGTPLFKPSSGRMKMKLLQVTPLGSGGVVLRYQPE